MAKKNRNAIDAPSASYEAMLPNWLMVDTIVAGTAAMRAAGQTYLPVHEAETQVRYKERLESAVLTNYLSWTLAQLAAKPFKTEVSTKDVNAALEPYLEDIDLQGNALHPFCASWFALALRKGMAHVLVDQPIGMPRQDGLPRTLEDDAKDGIRPYWTLIDPQNIICAMVQVIRGKETLTHIRILEVHRERQGYEEVTIPQIRVLEPGAWAVYQEREVKGPNKATKKEWVLVSSGTTGLDFIPLVTFYTNRTGPMECEPPLMDLAHLNVTHWQSSSDQRSVLTVARFPILAASGVPVSDDGKATLKIAPHQYFATEDPQGKFYYVEHTGSAIEAGRNDLKDLEEKMASYGADMLRKEPGNPTATAAAINSAEDATPLQRMVNDFQDSIDLALSYLARMKNLDEDQGGTSVVSYDPAEDVGGATDLESLIKLRASGDISRETILEEFKRRNVLSEDFDAEKDQASLDQEMPKPGEEVDQGDTGDDDDDEGGQQEE